ncbi:MAG: universal stress protein, partial [Acidobacteriota bacterium]|nr:universal stress protein [Acidobacteriota bacterium]
VMASHGRGGLSRLWLGSVTDGMVRNLHIPVLVTRGDIPDTDTPAATSASGTNTRANRESAESSANASMFPRVLVPLDGSANAEAVFPSISAIIMPGEATLALLRVVAPLSPSDLPRAIGGFAPSPYMSNIASEEAQAGAYLADVADSLRAIGIRATIHVVVHPNVATAILNFASESPSASGNLVNLIALAPHERTTTDRLLLGSVTDKFCEGHRHPCCCIITHQQPLSAEVTPSAVSHGTICPVLADLNHRETQAPTVDLEKWITLIR